MENKLEKNQRKELNKRIKATHVQTLTQRQSHKWAGTDRVREREREKKIRALKNKRSKTRVENLPLAHYIGFTAAVVSGRSARGATRPTTAHWLRDDY